jgi:uncharacterized membrane protein YccC
MRHHDADGSAEGVDPPRFQDATDVQPISEILQHIAAALQHSPARRAYGKAAPQLDDTSAKILSRQISSWAKDCHMADSKSREALVKNFDSILSVLTGEPLPHLQPLPHPQYHSWDTMILTVKTHLNFQSSVFRYALRVGVILGISTVLYHYIPLPLGYWVPLTALMVLKPDFFSTLVRSLDRVLGTFGGVILATALVSIPHIHTQMAIVLVVIFATAMYAVLNYNFALFTLFITAEIVVLLSFFEHLAPMATIEARLLDTLIGTGLALSAHLLWPRWQRSTVPKALDNVVHSSRMYLDYLMSHTGPGLLTGANTAYYRQQLQIAGINADSAVKHLLMHTDPRPIDKAAAVGVLTALHRFSNDLQRLENELVRISLEPSRENGMAPPAVRNLGLMLDRQLHVVEAVLRQDPQSSALLSEAVGEYARDPDLGPDFAGSSQALGPISENLNAHVALILRMLPLTTHTEQP